MEVDCGLGQGRSLQLRQGQEGWQLRATLLVAEAKTAFNIEGRLERLIRARSTCHLGAAADNHQIITENMCDGTVIGYKGEIPGTLKKCNLDWREGLDFRQGEQRPGLGRNGKGNTDWRDSLNVKWTGWG